MKKYFPFVLIFIITDIANAQPFWSRSNLPTETFIPTIIYHENSIITGSIGHDAYSDPVYYSNDEGLSWEVQRFSNDQTEAMIKKENELFLSVSGMNAACIVGYNTLLSPKDSYNYSCSKGSAFDMIKDSSGSMIWATSAGLWKSVDGLKGDDTKWEIIAFQDTSVTTIQQLQDKGLVVGTKYGVFRRLTNGSWKKISPNFNITSILYEQQEPYLPSNLFVGAENVGLMRSNDHGETWEIIFPSKKIYDIYKVDNNKIAFASEQGLYIYKIEEKTWIKTNINMPSFKIIKGKNNLFVATYSGVYKLSGDISFWENTNIPKTIIREVYHSENREVIYVESIRREDPFTGVHNLYKTTDKGKTWIEDTHLKKINPRNLIIEGNIIYGFSLDMNKIFEYNYIAKSIIIKDFEFSNPIHRIIKFGKSFMVLLKNGDVVLVENSGLVKSIRTGIEDKSIRDIIRDKEGNIFIKDDIDIFRYDLNNQNWVKLIRPCNNVCTFTSWIAGDDGMVYGIGAGVLVQLNASQGRWEWMPINGLNINHDMPGFYVNNKGNIFVGTDRLYRSAKFDEPFVEISNSILEPRLAIDSYRDPITKIIAMPDGAVLAGTQGNGIFISPEKILIANEEKVELPAKITLSQNYPNPFNPNTIITFTLPQSSEINLTVFDVLGKKISVLKTGWQNAGKHEVQFNAEDLPSGTYIYRLQVGNHVLTNKMMLVK